MDPAKIKVNETGQRIGGFRDENTAKWVVTLILSIAFIALGIVAIFDYKSKR